VVIKSLETHYRRVEGISGATILGDGRVALILDVPGLLRLEASVDA
jgi:two-component system chemotaxis sensor kinase CheA